MSKQPKALEFANELEAAERFFLPRVGDVYGFVDGEAVLLDDAAALLRSQHELIGELVAHLQELRDLVWGGLMGSGQLDADIRAALSKAKEQQ